jgi:membrane protein implicated in regulation of membrane protease activity
MIALYLTVLGAAAQWTGLLLWPAVVLHALIALALILLWRREQARR